MAKFSVEHYECLYCGNEQNIIVPFTLTPNCRKCRKPIDSTRLTKINYGKSTEKRQNTNA